MPEETAKPGALQLATAVVELAEKHSQNLCKINALITRGETKIDLGKTEEAREDLVMALELNGDCGAQKKFDLPTLKSSRFAT